MAIIPVNWRLEVKGSGEVKSELDRVSTAFNQAKISGQEYGKEQRALSTVVSRRLQEDRLQNRLLLAQHPNLLKVSRAMSTLTSITRTLLTISNALNLSKLAGQGADAESVRLQTERNAILRKIRELEDAGLKGTKAWIEAMESLNINTAETQEKLKQLDDAKFNNLTTSIEAIILVSAVVFGQVIKNLGFLKSGLAILGSIALAPALTALLGIAAAFIAAAVGGFFLGRAITDTILSSLGELEFFYWQHIKPAFTDFINFFIQDIPAVLGAVVPLLTGFWGFLILGFTNVWNGIITLTNNAINGLLSGIESLANGFISVINNMINAFNSIAKRLRIGTLPTLSGISLPRINIPTIAAATGFEGVVNSPTMFLAGEAGSEQVSITPHGGRGGNGSGTTIIVNIAGSVITEKQLAYKIDQIQKKALRSRGFTGT